MSKPRGKWTYEEVEKYRKIYEENVKSNTMKRTNLSMIKTSLNDWNYLCYLKMHIMSFTYQVIMLKKVAI